MCFLSPDIDEFVAQFVQKQTPEQGQPQESQSFFGRYVRLLSTLLHRMSIVDVHCSSTNHFQSYECRCSTTKKYIDRLFECLHKRIICLQSLAGAPGLVLEIALSAADGRSFDWIPFLSFPF